MSGCPHGSQEGTQVSGTCLETRPPPLPGHPGARAAPGNLLFPGEPGIWVLCSGAMAGWWVSLMLVLAPWLPGVQPCLLCFVPPTQRERLCHDITGAPVNDPRHRYCLEALVQAAVPLVSVTVGELRDPRDTQSPGTPIPAGTCIPRGTPTLTRTPEPSGGVSSVLGWMPGTSENPNPAWDPENHPTGTHWGCPGTPWPYVESQDSPGMPGPSQYP